MPPSLKTQKVKLADNSEVDALVVDGAGRFTYIDGEGKEKPGDFLDLLNTIKGDAATREALTGRAKTAEEKLAAYEKLGTPEDLTKATGIVAKLSAGEIKTAEQISEIQRATAAAEAAKWEGAVKAEQVKIADLTAKMDQADLRRIFDGVGAAKVQDAMKKEIPVFGAPADGLYSLLRDHFVKNEAGEWVAVWKPGDTSSANVIQDEAKFRAADPLVAVQQLIEKNPALHWLKHKPQGSGSGHGNDGGGGGDASKTDNPAQLIAQGLNMATA